MVRIAGYEFDTNVMYQVNSADASVVLEVYGNLNDEEMMQIKGATLLEAVTTIDGKDTVVGSYVLIAWRSLEKTAMGYRFTWNTFRIADINEVKKNNEVLEEALIELAAIIGGNGNG